MTGLTIKKIVFNDNTPIDLNSDDIVVFVGPNNMGKSQSLRDIFNAISNNIGNIVIREIEIAYHNPEALKDNIERNSLVAPNGQYFSYRGYNYDIYSPILNGFGTQFAVDANIRNYLVSMVKTEERLTTSSPKMMINPGEPNQYPLQYIIEPANRQRISNVFEKIFGLKIFCEDRGSTMLTLHMGDDIDFDKDNLTVQQISDELYKRISALPKVQEQGDGIRSLAGLMLNMMMPNYTVFMLDEPEAFLHPPQARVLGENLPSLLGERQSFISTHSIELIKGLLIAAEHRVRIIRITRNGALNPVHYLTPANLKEIWKDPLMRHSNVLDGLFYQHTVLCESDSDCQLYAAIYGKIKERQNSYSDTLFTLCNGKGRMKSLSKTLKSLGVDYRIVPDLDFFNDEVTVREVYINCGGDWAAIESDYKTLFNAMNQPDGTMSPDDFVREVRKIIYARGWDEMTKHHASRLGRDIPQVLENQWDKLKHKGVDFINDPGVRAVIERLISAMNAVGIFPVKKGELESFFPEVGNHGPGYAVSVLEKYPDLGAPEYKEMQEFVESWGI